MNLAVHVYEHTLTLGIKCIATFRLKADAKAFALQMEALLPQNTYTIVDTDVELVDENQSELPF